MTNLALVLLSLTLGAEPSTAGATKTAAPAAGAEATPKPIEGAVSALPAPAEAEPVPPPPSPAATVAKPSENDIEVLSEVVDLQETVDPTAAWYGKGYPERVRILALPTGRTVRKGGFELVIDHRASKAIYNKDSDHPFADMWNDFGGFDSALSVGLGLRYGILDGLDAGLYRVNASQFDTYEFDARYQVLRQEDHNIDLTIKAGLSWFVVPDHKDALWPFAQLFVSRLFLNRLLVTAGAMYHANSSPSTARGAKYSDENHKWSVAGAGGLELRLAAKVSLDAEIVACAAGYCRKNPAFSSGVKFFTNRHTFALVCGNTQYLTADGYITNTDTPWSKLVIGFNITREY
ncbi:MAG TPA: DUF5777 family beta-barrel protein [Polyangia bacterium]